MKRSGPIRRPKKPPASLEERQLRAAWKAAVGPVCQVCPVEGGECSGPIQGHHVVAQGALRRRGLAHPTALWDLRIKLDVCERRHDLHTRAIKRIPLELVPPAAFEFAREHRLEWWITRFYAA